LEKIREWLERKPRGKKQREEKMGKETAKFVNRKEIKMWGGKKTHSIPSKKKKVE